MDKYKDIVDSWNTPNTIAGLECKLENHRILFAYHSVKIENEEVTYADTREIFENGKVINFTGDLRTLFEIQNQKICYDFIQQKIPDHEPITSELIKKIHKLLMSKCYDERRYHDLGERPGEYRKHEYTVGIHGVGLPCDNINEEIEYLCDQLLENETMDKLNVLRIGCWFHLNFEYIHPFADGNGRTGRTLLNYYLITHDHPPVVIHNEDKKEYYAALEAFDEKEDINRLVEFVKRQIEKTWSPHSKKREPCVSQ